MLEIRGINARKANRECVLSRGDKAWRLSGNNFRCQGATSFSLSEAKWFSLSPVENRTKNSSGNRAPAQLPEPFCSQKQSPGTVRKPCGSNLGNIPGTLFGSSTDLIAGTALAPSFHPPIDLPSMASKRSNTRASSPWEVVSKRGNHCWEVMQEQ